MKKRRLVWAARLATALWLVSTAAQADRLTDAEELFGRAKRLMAAKKPAEACPLFEESQRLDPQMGTLLNLAICHESVGRLASAWGEFRAVEQQARAANRADRVKLARERATKLEPRLSRIKIELPSEARVPGLVVTIDGEEKGEPLWSGVAVDPGTRVVEASAPGKIPAVVEVVVDQEGAITPVVLPILEDEPTPEIAPPEVPRAPEERYEANRAKKKTGLVVGGAGAAALAAGGVFGVLALLADGDATDACPQPCVAGTDAARAADAATDRALVFANVANVVIPIGIVAAAVGGYMFLSAGPTDASRAARAFVSPGPGGGAVGVRW